MNKSLLTGLTCICMLVLFACTSEQKLTRKAVMRVLTDKHSFDTVGRLYVDLLHPCASDTTFATHTDTFTTVKIDTIYPKTGTPLNLANTGTILPGKWEGGPIIREKHTTTISKKDTGYIVNKQREKLYQDEVAELLRDKTGLQQAVLDGQGALKAANKERTKYIWLFVAACVGIGLIGGAWAYFGLRSRVKSITHVLPH